MARNLFSIGLPIAFFLGGISSNILTRLIKKRLQGRRCSEMANALLKLQTAVQQAMQQRGGPNDVFQWPDVSKAPAPSMDVTNMRPGESVSFEDSRGAIYRFKICDGVIVNLYYTKAGVRRSGDLHDSHQFDIVMKGKVRLRQIDPNGKEIVSLHDAHDYIIIPPGTPHMFEMLEDNVLLEWWGADFSAWYFKPYRDVISNALPLEATENKSFSRR
jgi:hypothetical protein